VVTLRLGQSAAGDGTHRVEAELSGDGIPRQRAVANLRFAVPRQDAERIRWYLEDFLEFPLDPNPAIAEGVEQRLAEIGEQLFTAVFGAGDAARLWARLQGRLTEARVEIATEVADAAALPWELLRDPATRTPVALEAAAFVRVNHQPARPVQVATAEADRLRVLLVICRPAGDADVPFRSVASHLIRLGAASTDILDLDVLRPPTFAALARTLDAANQAGRPYHVVHFDGHGSYLDSAALLDDRLPAVPLSRHRYGRRNFVSPPQPGRHGYLIFEDPAVAGNSQFVDGPALGDLLARTGVSVLVLNACRSAYTEAPPAPKTDSDPAVSQAADAHGPVRAYGSLALEVTDAGVPGVIAMRYNVYAVTAAQFIADLYTALLDGQPLGAAVSAGRRQLAAQPNRSIAFDPIPLQDWTVPVVYEAAPLPVLTGSNVSAPGKLVVPTEAEAADGGTGTAPDGLPHRPEVGFFGRDETLLALDRAFDRHRVVVLHAYAGSGKTSTAVEFARWYAATGGLADAEGVDGVVLFSSLEQYTPLPRLLNQLAEVFDPLLKANNIPWPALNDRQRRGLAVQLLGLVPVLWIWDNVEPVAGFPAGTESAWTPAEQAELVDFLRDVAEPADSKAKLLLTSRRDEHGWLGNLPARVTLPPMPMRERIQLTQALAERHGHRIGEVEDWRPLLRYTAGNPLTVTVLVGQALRESLTSKAQIAEFVNRLRAGESDVDDDETEGRSKSLGASLGYGLASAFTDTERAQLAVLHLFQDTVGVGALVDMGHPENAQRLPELAGLTRETGLALLDRAADIGLLTALGGGWYTIHPALPWYFRHLYEVAGTPETSKRAEAAYTAAIANVGRAFWGEYNQGRHQAIDVLRVEEANLLHALALGRRAARWNDVIGCMQGLRSLYQHFGRGAEWSRLVEQLVPDLVDPATGGPRPGVEEQWGLLTGYRIRVAIDDRDWSTAEQLQHTRLDYARAQAAVALSTLDAAPDQLTGGQRNDIRSVAVNEHGLGDILREQHNPDCLAHYERAAELERRIGARREEGMAAYNLGLAYVDIPAIQDLERAEQWYRRSLELFDVNDRIGRAATISQLGQVAYERFRGARNAGEPDDVLIDHLNTAANAYHQALDDLPKDAVNELATVHNQLGNIYQDAGDVDTALSHYQQSIRYMEHAGNRYGAGKTRYNIALLLGRARRADDALLYARAALGNFEPYGANAAADIERTQHLIVEIERARNQAAT
jgi:tetratricopeptide (TPR) repeat protein